MCDGFRVPFEGSGKPLLTGKFMIFPWIRREQAGENLAVIRHTALNLLTEETSFKAGIKRKQKKANRSNSYLSQVLAGQGAS